MSEDHFSRLFAEDVGAALNIGADRVGAISLRAPLDRAGEGWVTFSLKLAAGDDNPNLLSESFASMMDQIAFSEGPLFEGQVTRQLDPRHGVERYESHDFVPLRGPYPEMATAHSGGEALVPRRQLQLPPQKRESLFAVSHGWLSGGKGGAAAESSLLMPTDPPPPRGPAHLAAGLCGLLMLLFAALAWRCLRPRSARAKRAARRPGTPPPKIAVSDSWREGKEQGASRSGTVSPASSSSSLSSSSPPTSPSPIIERRRIASIA